MTLAVAVMAAGCVKRKPAPPPADTVRFSQRNEPADLDPARSSLPDDFMVIRALSEGMVAPSPDNGPVLPAAAVSWDVSADGLHYTFHLREGGQWSNGESVTAADFVDSYRRLLTPDTASPKASLFFMVKNAQAYALGALGDFSLVGFRAAGPLTLVVTLEHPVPRFLQYVASGPWIPVHPPTVTRHGRNWTKPGHFVGNGPFNLVEWRPHQRIVVRKNPLYHGAAQVRLAGLHFLAFASGDTEERAYRAGQVDVTMAVPYGKLPGYARNRPRELHRAPLAETRYLAFNLGRPPLNDLRVRRALSLAIDREQLVSRVLRGGQTPAWRLLPPALRASDDTEPCPGNFFREDEVAARQLLAEAGFPGGHGFPRLELSTWVDSPVVVAIQAMWKRRLGIEVALATLEAQVHLTRLQEASYDVAFINVIPDVLDPANLLEDFVTGAADNHPHWADARYDTLLFDAARTADPAAQAAKLREAENRLLARYPLAPLYFNVRHALVQPRVRGWRNDALWNRFYLGLETADN